MCAGCGMRVCAMNKGIKETCAHCVDFPCDMINEFMPKGQGTRDYLDELNEEQRAKYEK